MTHQRSSKGGYSSRKNRTGEALYDLSDSASGGRKDHERTETTEKIAASQDESYCKRECAGENGTRRTGSGLWVTID